VTDTLTPEEMELVRTFTAVMVDLKEEIQRGNDLLVEAINHLVREEEARHQSLVTALERFERGVTGI
jgi:hypothetical protein